MYFCSSSSDIRIKEEPEDTELFTPDNTAKKDLLEKAPVKMDLLEKAPTKMDLIEKAPVKKDLLEKAPVIPFGKDLEHWENPDQIEAPLEVK